MSNPQDLIRALVDMAPAMSRQQTDVADVIYRLLAEGRPVTDQRIAQGVDYRADEARRLMDDMPGIFRDEDGRIVGFLGLTIEKTPHRIDVDGRILYAWCALDTLFLPRVLRTSGRVSSTSPAGGAPVELEVTPEEARPVESGVVMSVVCPDPEQFRTNVLSSFCHHIYFFRSFQAAETWRRGRADVVLLDLHDAYRLGRRLIERLFPGSSRRARTPAGP